MNFQSYDMEVKFSDFTRSTSGGPEQKHVEEKGLVNVSWFKKIRNLVNSYPK